MPKRMTKTQQKNAYKAMIAKAKKLWTQDPPFGMSTKDYMEIEKICMKYLKKNL